MDGLILSFQLFSRIPINREVEFSKKNLRIALYCLPIVGFIIGAMTGGVMFYFKFTNPFIASALGLATYFFVSGGLHLDGLSDMADGFMANKDREQTLEIMKDSLIGSFGTIALILYFIIKFSLYASIESNVILTTGITSMLSRTMVLLTIRIGKLSRLGGFGAAIKESLEESSVEGLGLIVFSVLIFTWYFTKSNFLSIILAIIAVNLVIIWISNRKIGGLTGDIYGAIIELSELAILLVWGRIIIWI